MTTPRQLSEFVKGLQNAVVLLKGGHRTIDLNILTRDLPEHDSLLAWWKGKNMTKHLSNNIALTILELNPPEDVKAAMLFLMM